MRTEYSITRHFIVPTLALLLCVMASAVSTYAGGICKPTTACPPSSPSEIELELGRAIDNLNPTTPRSIGCEKWFEHNDPVFSEWDNGGSMNLPALTATVGLYRFPTQNMVWRVRPRHNPNPTGYQISYVNWWIWFLASQTGQTPGNFLPANFVAPPTRSNLRYFKGTELFSNMYEAPVVTSVIAVRYWAHLKGNQALITLSELYLKANWALYGMAAGAGPVWTYDLPGRTAVPAFQKPARDTQYQSSAPRAPNGGYLYSGHFLALAGGRSMLRGKWESDDKFPLFDRAIEWSVTQNNENPCQAETLDRLVRKWTPPPAGSAQADQNLYALTSADRENIKALVNNDDSSKVSLLMPWLRNIRTAMTYRIIGWTGWRASSMAANLNHNTPNMYGISYRAVDPADPSHAKATFLFPWADGHKAPTEGWCNLEPTLMRANNGLANPKEVTMELPTDQRLLFHLVLSTNDDPKLDTTPQSSWPPPVPKALDTSYPPPVGIAPDTAFGGNIAWVFDRVPAGGAATGYNEDWNWIDSNPSPYSESALTHQSNLVAGMHQHYFTGATETMSVGAGDALYTYIYQDPANPPSEVMLQWFEPNTGWEHRAFWGADNFPVGTSGTASRYRMGPLPQVIGDWVRLEVPASFVGLEGRTVNGMAFTLYDGQATWGEAGKNIEGAQPINVALGRPAIQSSTYLSSAAASMAVDGNPNGAWSGGSLTHTNNDYQAWWQVDMGASYALQQINVWNRTDCCSDRLSNFYVFVSDQPFNYTDAYTTSYQPGVSTYYVSGQGGIPSVLTVRRSGRYVRVQLSGTNYLSLAEVEVLSLPGSQTPPPAQTETVWVDDSTPAGSLLAGEGNDTWQWIGSGVSPGPYSLSLAHQSNIFSGMHQHYFYRATNTLKVNPGDVLFTWVYLDPANMPSEVMLQWNDGTWDHRAYWGANNILSFGTDGTISRRYMGVLPTAGKWLRLEVPASLVGLEGSTINGMAFTLYGGRATWDRAGKIP